MKDLIPQEPNPQTITSDKTTQILLSDIERWKEEYVKLWKIHEDYIKGNLSKTMDVNKKLKDEREKYRQAFQDLNNLFEVLVSKIDSKICDVDRFKNTHSLIKQALTHEG